MKALRALVVVAAARGAGCSLLVDTSDRTQCTTTADCDASTALRGRVCQSGFCVLPTRSPQTVSTDGGAGCGTTQLCTQVNSGRAAVCKKPGEPCVTWQLPECPSIGGDWKNPDALVVGSLLPLHVKQGDGTALENPYTKRLLRAMDLGLDEFTKQVPAGFLAPGGRSRPLALLHCDTNGDPETAKRLFRHLTEVVGAPAVIVGWDEDLVAIADEPNASKTAIVCSDCLAPFPGLGVMPTAWKILPPITSDVPLVAWRVAQLEAAIKKNDPSDVRVALVAEPYRVQTTFAQALGAKLVFNGKSPSANGSNFLGVTTEDPRKVTAVDFDAVADSIAAFAPHVVVVDMSPDFPRHLLTRIEAKLPANAPRPYYVLTQLAYEAMPYQGLLDDDALRLRISGTRPATPPPLKANIDAFEYGYRTSYHDAPDGTYSGYEAFYSLGYALAAASADPLFDGPRVSSSFQSLVSGTTVDVGPAMLPTGLGLLLSSTKINLRGLDSELDWDLQSHEIATDMAMFCFGKDPNGRLFVEDGGDAVLSAKTGQITGTFSCK